MSITYAALKTRVGTVLQDPDQKTFTAAMVEELIQSALTEVGRIAPEQFSEDLTPVENQFSYALRTDAFESVAVPEIEVMRVEVWDASQAADRFIAAVVPASGLVSYHDAGWVQWAGELTLPSRTVRGLVGHEDDYVIRVWGYSPYVPPVTDDDVIATSGEATQALLDYVKYEALGQLLASRDLFTQWQTRSGNTDLSYAGLMNQRAQAGEEWRKKSNRIARLRSTV